MSNLTDLDRVVISYPFYTDLLYTFFFEEVRGAGGAGMTPAIPESCGWTEWSITVGSSSDGVMEPCEAGLDELSSSMPSLLAVAGM